MKVSRLALVGALALSAFGTAEAREAGEWIARVGVSNVGPTSGNGDVLGGAAELDIDDKVSLTFNGTYMFTNNIGVELLAALPFEHDISAEVVGVGRADLGSTKHLPPTLSVQWHSNPIGSATVYAGLGINYTVLFDEELTRGARDLLGAEKLGIDNSVGLAIQLGADFQFTDRMFGNIDVRYIDIDADVSLDGNEIGEANIDPIVVGFHLGWSF